MRTVLPLSCALAILAAAPDPLPAQEKILRAFPLNPDGAVRIFNDAGAIRVIGWDKDSVVITGTLARGAQLFGGGGYEGVKFFVEGPKPGASAKMAGVSDLVVRLPARARVWLKAASADIEVSAFAGQLDVDAVASRVRVQGTPSELRVETMNGDVDVTASPRYLRLKTATGRVTWSGSSEDAALTTVSGNIVVNAGTVTRARFESIDGHIRFSGALTKTAAVSFDTHAGDVTLLLPRDADLSVEATAPASDLFGKRFPRSGAAAQRGTNSATLGKPSVAGPAIIVRSFKGRVTASLQ
ncbi:MAG TPA: DUF4097 family beta strand repeat-containing protein [Gemmatimonadaceae bacterium]|nr:DUF4097 family beta strand repeat-containing protein [Gemmatimonadaceae bacterium]